MQASVIVGILLIVFLIIMAVYVYLTYRNQTGIFSPYTPNLGPGLFQPGGDVIRLTPEQLACRQIALGQQVSAKDENGNVVPTPTQAQCDKIDPYTNLSSSSSPSSPSPSSSST